MILIIKMRTFREFLVLTFAYYPFTHYKRLLATTRLCALLSEERSLSYVYAA